MAIFGITPRYLWFGLPLTGYFIGSYIDHQETLRMTNFRDKSALFGGKVKEVLRGRPIIVEWERDARHSAGLSLVRLRSIAISELKTGRGTKLEARTGTTIENEAEVEIEREIGISIKSVIGIEIRIEKKDYLPAASFKSICY
ncbi:hypothetical protein EVAR_50741_1 [Eumeta japonica]|uniref:Uncharacterized protein n=1 Tax=Eumeta variegata TaxID=151549 RepID=A0A4C1Y568_EUMVA|nr:hypothetical protein EVAR_50741_1 [Eumeta japonica]